MLPENGPSEAKSEMLPDSEVPVADDGLEPGSVAVSEALSDEEELGGGDEGFGDDLDTLPTTEEVRRDRYRRRRQLEAFLGELGITSELAVDALVDIDKLLPDPLGLSSSGSLEARISSAANDAEKFRSSIYQHSISRVGFDALDDIERRFRDNPAVGKMVESEESLLRAMMVNERVRGAYSVKLAEHDAARSFLIQELVRRRAMAENWRYRIPKYLLPVMTAFHLAEVSSRDFRPRSKLYNQLVDMLVGFSRERHSALSDTAPAPLTRALVLDAMNQTEDQFTALLAIEDDPFGALDNSGAEGSSEGSSERSPAPESMEDMQTRAAAYVADLVEARAFGESDSEEANLPKDYMHVMTTMVSMGGGINHAGQLVFSSADAFCRGLLQLNMATLPSERKAEIQARLQAVDGEQPAAQADNSPVEPAAVPATEPASKPAAAPSSGANDLDLFPEPKPEPKPQSKPEPAKPEQAKPEAPNPPQASEDLSSYAPLAEPHLVLAGGEWPVKRLAPEVQGIIKDRSHGFNRSVGNGGPFDGWAYTPERHPFSFAPLRANVESQAASGPLRPLDMNRLESTQVHYQIEIRVGRSEILGMGHELMLPPSSSLDWYAGQLGWQEVQIRHIRSFGEPWNPSSVKPAGDIQALLELMRGNADLQLRKLMTVRPDDFFTNTGEGASRLAEATEDLARWWLFVLLARHDPDGFDLQLGAAFFHGVEAPDFVLAKDGTAVFGPSYLRLWKHDIENKKTRADVPDRYLKHLRRLPASMG